MQSYTSILTILATVVWFATLIRANNRNNNFYQQSSNRYQHFGGTMSPEGNINYIVSVLRQEMDGVRNDIKDKLGHIQYHITNELRKTKDELRRTNKQLKKSLNRIDKERQILRRQFSQAGGQESWRYEDIHGPKRNILKKNKSRKRRLNERRRLARNRKAKYVKGTWSLDRTKWTYGYETKGTKGSWYNDRHVGITRNRGSWYDDRAMGVMLNEPKGIDALRYDKHYKGGDRKKIKGHKGTKYGDLARERTHNKGKNHKGDGPKGLDAIKGMLYDDRNKGTDYKGSRYDSRTLEIMDKLKIDRKGMWQDDRAMVSRLYQAKGDDGRHEIGDWYENRRLIEDRLHEDKWLEDRRQEEILDDRISNEDKLKKKKQDDSRRILKEEKIRSARWQEDVRIVKRKHESKRAEVRHNRSSSKSSRLSSEVLYLKKKIRKSLKGLIAQGEEIKNELRSQKAEMYAIRNSVYDTREDLQEKGNLVLLSLQSTNSTFMCYLNDLRMYLFKINSNFGLLKRDQERMKDLIIMSQSYDTEELEPDDEDEEEGDSLFGQKKYLPGCTPNPLETQETLQTFGSGPVFNNYTFTSEREYGYFPVHSRTSRPRHKPKSADSASTLYPAIPENCMDPHKSNLDYPPMPSDCRDVYELGFTDSGTYRIQPAGMENREVLCDHETVGGGWTVIIARRQVPRHIAFNKTWHQYENGFGDPTREFWIGLKSLHILTKENAHHLRADMEDWDGNLAWASYNYFTVAGPEDKYRLRVSGYTGTAGDSMRHSHLQMFSTVDQDNDQEDWGNCARSRGGGGWWWGRCACTQPTGQYRRAKNERGITWYHWKDSNYSLKTLVLMIKPRD